MRVYQTPLDIQKAILKSPLYRRQVGRTWSIEITEGKHRGTYHGFWDEIEATRYANEFKRYGNKPNIQSL